MTNRQKQHLLGYLGYYQVPVDGIWGQASRSAAQRFLRDQGLPVQEELDEAAQETLRKAVAQDRNWWDSIRYWSREEFRCRCGGKYCSGFPAEPERKLVELAEQVRVYFGRPGVSSSGLRCETHNRICGGVKNSRHLAGKALDFCIQGISAREVLAYVQKLSGVRYAYAIDDSYIHMDIE